MSTPDEASPREQEKPLAPPPGLLVAGRDDAPRCVAGVCSWEEKPAS